MTDRLIHFLTAVSALGCGVVGGIFFAFSTFVMKALSRLPAAQGIAAMQAINVAVLNQLFFAALFGTAAGCLTLSLCSLLKWQSPGSLYRLIGCALYLVGTILVTMLCNVPRNNALAPLEPRSEEGANCWLEYVRAWTAWNHVRTIAALAAAVCLTIALCSSDKQANGATANTAKKEEGPTEPNPELTRETPQQPSFSP